MEWILETEVDGISQYISSDKKYISCTMEPHKGTDWKWMVRINKLDTFDRWSICDIEEFFGDELSAMDYLNSFNGY